MARLLVLISLVTLAALPLAGLATAQESTPAASRITALPVDLQATVLYPRDPDALGLPGFGIVRTTLSDSETQAALDLLNDDDSAAELVTIYRDSGFGHRYRLSLLRPRIPVVESSPGVFSGDVRIVTSVTEFASAQGAALAFPVIEDERGDPAAQDVPGTRSFGEQSEVTHYSQQALDGSAYKELNLTFRVGNLIADVSVIDHTAAEPEMATTEALAEALLAKAERAQAQQTAALGVIVERGRAEKANPLPADARPGRAEPAPGPGLSWRVLRLTPDPERIYRGFGYDGYIRLDREDVPEFAALAEALQASGSAAAPAPTPAVKTIASDRSMASIASYHYFTPVGEGDPTGLPIYRVQLRRYPSAEAAAGLEGMARYWEWIRQPLAPGGPIMEQTVDEDAMFGDEGFAVWIGYGEGGAAATRRYAIYARVGAMLAIMDIDDLPPDAKPPAAVMATLAAAQMACLRVDATEWCEPAPAPTLDEPRSGFA